MQQATTHDLGQFAQNLANNFDKRTFLHYPEGKGFRSVSYAQFLARTDAWAQRLRAQEVQPGDRVAFITPKSPNQVFAFYACWRIGAIAVPICEALGNAEMTFVIQDSEPSLILVDETMQSRVTANAGDIPLLSFSQMPDFGSGGMTFERHENDPDDVAALIYTSGSTGMPKGVMLTHRNFTTNAVSAVEKFHFTQSDRVISLLPYWHSFALIVELLVAPSRGACTIIPRDKRDFKRNIATYKPTVVLVVPRIMDALKTSIEKRIQEQPGAVQKLVKQATYNASRIFTAGSRIDGGLLRMFTHHTFYNPLVFRAIRKNFGGKLRFFVSGGAPLDMDNQIFFKYLGIPVYQGYGLTESTPVISTNNEDVHRLGSSGPLLSWLTPEQGGDYTFKDQNGELGKNLKGELLVKGDCVMKGYWRHTDASAKTLVDGWLHTGDMGYVDEDGFLFLDGRQGNMIVLYGGEKLHPEHVEDVVKTAEAVTECMVIGEKCKNVYALANVDAKGMKNIPSEERQDTIRKRILEKTPHLASYQKPKDVLILPEFTVEDGTLTVTLKVRRHKVWEKYGEEIRAFLMANGEEAATQTEVGIASSKIMESLGKA
ncbi:MAG: AMP-binding protein [Lentisphaeria bacterium]|nr:AMP-binding protein [Lentisphaeria bacterium]